MDRYDQYDRMRCQDTFRPAAKFGQIQGHDVAQWGYIILYLVVIIGSLIGNCLFLFTIKKNQHLRSTPHFFFSSLAIRDLIVTILVVPFVIDSQAVKRMWTIGDPMCKFYTFMNYGTMATHGFTLVFLLLFLYFWYRKQEAYVTEDGQTVIRKTRMHKWSIPLACVLAAGLAVSAGAIAGSNCNTKTGIQSCTIWNIGQSTDSAGYKIALTLFFVAFLLPLIILIFALIALSMQIFGCREPRLDPPHSRIALTGVLLIIIYAVLLSPYQVYEAMLLFQGTFGTKLNQNRSAPGLGAWSFETDMILNAMIYVACVIHPIIYFSVNPEYRSGLTYAWKNLYCNMDPIQREREEAEKRQKRSTQRQYPGRDTRNPIIKKSGEPLITRRQPQIMPSGVGQPHYYPYPQDHPQHSGTLQPLLGHTNNFGGAQYPTSQILFPDQHFIDTSFESALTGHVSPQLPPVFEYDGLKYIDTARLEPRIAYSPEKTPPKTPDTPHFGQKPFRNPLDGMMVNPELGIATIPMQSPQPFQEHFEMVDMSSPIATSELKEEERPKRSSMELEILDVSPGNTLRDRNRRQQNSLSPPVSPTGDISPVPVVEILQESPGNRQRRRTTEQEERTAANTLANTLIPTAYTNGANISSSRPSLGASSAGGERPASRNSGVEIVITGRTRSRTDLCPEVPKSKFEHSV